MHTEWRERVKQEVVDASFLDPTTHGLEDVKQYTRWDLDAIKKSDIVFAYFEVSNPVGYNMAFELGIAYQMRKCLIFVNEKFADNTRPVSMLCEMAIVVTSLDAGIRELQAQVDKRLPSWWWKGCYDPG